MAEKVEVKEDKPVEKVAPKSEKELNLNEKFYTYKKAAPMLFMSVFSLRRHVKAGNIKATQHVRGGQHFITESEIKRIRKILDAGGYLKLTPPAKVPEVKAEDKTKSEEIKPEAVKDKPDEEYPGLFFLSGEGW